MVWECVSSLIRLAPLHQTSPSVHCITIPCSPCPTFLCRRCTMPVFQVTSGSLLVSALHSMTCEPSKRVVSFSPKLSKVVSVQCSRLPSAVKNRHSVLTYLLGLLVLAFLW